MIYKGIDVSKWNAAVDFKKVRSAGYDFVIIRAGYGKHESQKDKYFEQNYRNAKAAGLGVGAYWYSYAETEAEAKTEAAVFLKVIKGKTFEYPLAFDIEEKAQYNLGTAAVDKLIYAFCGEIEKAGYYCMICSYDNFFKNRVSEKTRKRFDVWCANYNRAPSVECGIHQYSSTGKVNGCSGDVDLNITEKNYPAIIKAAGLNGFKKNNSSTNTATAEKPKTHTVVKGDCLWNIAAKYLGKGSRYTEIMKLNGLTSHFIYVGQKLKIPNK